MAEEKKLLLHMCCGPCALMPITHFLGKGYRVTAWFMNPNIQPLSEYLRRREAAEACCAYMKIPVLFEDCEWDITKWLRQVRDRDEKPDRCVYCCESRVLATFQKAKALGYTHVSTSLLYSIYQPHEVIRLCGERLSKEFGIPFLYEDFRKDWQAGIDLSKEIGLYRQPYCGCVYSEAERYQKKLRRLIEASPAS